MVTNYKMYKSQIIICNLHWWFNKNRKTYAKKTVKVISCYYELNNYCYDEFSNYVEYQMRQSIQERTKQILWNTAFKKIEGIWSA